MCVLINTIYKDIISFVFILKESQLKFTLTIKGNIYEETFVLMASPNYLNLKGGD